MSATPPSLARDLYLSKIDGADYIGSYFTSQVSIYTRKFSVITDATEDGRCSFCEATSQVLAFHPDANPPTVTLTLGECPQKKPNTLHGRLVKEKDGILLLGAGTIWQQTGQWDRYELDY